MTVPQRFSDTFFFFCRSLPPGQAFSRGFFARWRATDSRPYNGQRRGCAWAAPFTLARRLGVCRNLRRVVVLLTRPYFFQSSKKKACFRKRSLTRVTKSYLLALETTQISYSFTKHWTKFLTHQAGNYPLTCFVSKPSRIISARDRWP